MDRNVSGIEDVLELMDGLFDDDADRWTNRGARWWDRVYGDRGRGVPFFRGVEALATLELLDVQRPEAS